MKPPAAVGNPTASWSYRKMAGAQPLHPAQRSPGTGAATAAMLQSSG